MSVIKGDKQTIDWAKNQKAGSSSVYINWDAIASLPDEYEAVVTRVGFDVVKDFTNVGTQNSPSYYPSTDLLYKIGNARGVSGGTQTESRKLIEEVDISPLLMKPPGSEPEFRRRHVGHSVSKYSTVVSEDGTLRRSSVCTSEYDAWTRCLESWATEDEKRIDKKEAAPKFGWRYDSTRKRELSLVKELKHSAAKAETKAHCKTIRELAGLQTGYSPADLKDGFFTFAQIQRSELSIKAESAARLAAISSGADGGRRATEALFGAETSPALPPPEERPDADWATDSEILEGTVEENPETPRVVALRVLRTYKENGFVPEAAQSLYDKVVPWIESADYDVTMDPEKWPATLKLIARLENEGYVPKEKKIDHDLPV